MLFNKQKSCVRLITMSKYNAHTQPLFHSLNILPLDSLQKLQIAMIMHSIFHGYTTIDFEGVFNIEMPNEAYYLRRRNGNFLIPLVRTEFLKRFPLFKYPLIWNEICSELKFIESKLLFKTNLKYFLLSELSDFSCERLFCFTCSNL